MPTADLAARYPLAWPQGRPRTAGVRLRASFQVPSFAAARDELLHELRLFGATGVVLSTNVEMRRNGLPYGNKPEPADPGVAVYFRRKGRDLAFACDRWDRARDNLRAITKTVEAIRGIGRWGTGNAVDQAVGGFTALPPGPVGGNPLCWWEVLNVHRDTLTGTVTEVYRRLALEHHPDRGGRTEDMQRVNAAYEAFRQERGL